MHSASMKMSNADFLAHTDAMIALLQDPLFIDKIKEAQDVVKEIQKIVQIEFNISSTDELKVLTEKTSSLQEQNDRLQEEVNTLKIKYTELENCSEIRDNAFRSLIESEAGQREDAIEKLKAEINEKENQLKELSTELILVKKLIKQDKDLYRKMDIRVKNVETTLDKTTTEFREIKQSHFSLVEQVQRIQHEMHIGQLLDLDSKNIEQRNADIHVHNLEEENAFLKENMNEKLEELQELRSKYKELEHKISTETKPKSEIQVNPNLLRSQNANKELVGMNEKLTGEVQQLQSELRQTKERDDGKECTKAACKSRIEALEYANETLESEIEKLSSKDNMKDLAATLYAYEERNTVLEAQLTVSSNEKEKVDSFIEQLKYDLQMEQNISKQHEHQIQGLNTDVKRISSEKEVQQERHKIEITSLEKQIKTLHHDKENKEIELNDRNEQIQYLVSENGKLKKDLQRDSQTSDEYRLRAESNIDSLNKRIQNLVSEKEKLNNDLKRVSKTSYEYRSQVESSIDSLNLEKTQLEIELTRKEEECQLLKQENTNLKTAESNRNAKEDIDAIFTKPINIRLPDDDATPWVSGTEFMSSGDLVICDGKNKKIKVLDKSFDVKGSVTLQSQPWDVSEIDSNTVVVTLPYVKQIQVVQVQPTMTERRTIHLDQMCWGIQVIEGEIFATHVNRLGEGGVISLSLEGKVKRRIKAYNFDRSPIKFVNPENLAVNKFGIRVISVSDNYSNSVTVVNMDGTVSCQYADPVLQSPRGLCFDKRWNVIVCGSGSNNLQIVSLFGEKLKTILAPKNPMSVAYHREDDVIVVGFDTDHLLVLDLKRLFKE